MLDAFKNLGPSISDYSMVEEVGQTAADSISLDTPHFIEAEILLLQSCCKMI